MIQAGLIAWAVLSVPTALGFAQLIKRRNRQAENAAAGLARYVTPVYTTSRCGFGCGCEAAA